jgi:hypothetical protein
MLNHPNIVAGHDVRSHEALPRVVMKLHDGETLCAGPSKGQLPAHKPMDQAPVSAHGLAGAHEVGIVQQDLIPENLFLTNQLKIPDCALAKLSKALQKIICSTAAGADTRITQTVLAPSQVTNSAEASDQSEIGQARPVAAKCGDFYAKAKC